MSLRGASAFPPPPRIASRNLLFAFSQIGSYRVDWFLRVEVWSLPYADAFESKLLPKLFACNLGRRSYFAASLAVS